MFCDCIFLRNKCLNLLIDMFELKMSTGGIYARINVFVLNVKCVPTSSLVSVIDTPITSRRNL